MCVPPCEAGENPMPPNPASRPECMSTSATRADPSRTWRTANRAIIAAAWYRPRYARGVAAGDEARARVQRLLVTGDNRLKQGVAPERVRESYEQALEAAREAGIEDAVRPLVELRLADLAARPDTA